MNNKEILKKAIQKAMDNGFPKLEIYKDWLEIYIDDSRNGNMGINDVGQMFIEEYPAIIFNHDFAKAFWDEESVDEYGLDTQERELEILPGSWGFHHLRWQYHLQQMVLEENPIKYLEHFLD